MSKLFRFAIVVLACIFLSSAAFGQTATPTFTPTQTPTSTATYTPTNTRTPTLVSKASTPSAKEISLLEDYSPGGKDSALGHKLQAMSVAAMDGVRLAVVVNAGEDAVVGMGTRPVGSIVAILAITSATTAPRPGWCSSSGNRG